MIRGLATALVVGLSLLMLFPPGRGESRDPGEPIVQIVTPHGQTILAELADTSEKRARGLMFRQSLPPGRGMLFAFAEPQAWTFWMKNTRIPLDIIWLDGQKRIVHVQDNVPGCDRQDDGCPQYQPNDEALYVLELAAGQAQALRLRRGSRLNFDLGSVSPEASPIPPRTRSQR